MTIPSGIDESLEPGTPPRVERARRVPAQREAPLRSAATAFRSARSVSADAAPRPGSAQSEVEAAVETAYRVYDEYMRWGQQTAAQRTSSTDWSTPMAPTNPDPRAVATHWMEMLQETYRLWMGMVMPVMPNAQGFSASPPGPPPPPSPFPPAPWSSHHAEPAAPALSALDFEVETSRRTSVRIQFLHRPSAGELKVYLHREEGEGRFELTFDALAIRIQLPADQPPGTYRGVVQDGQGRQCGMMTIHVGDSPSHGT